MNPVAEIVLNCPFLNSFRMTNTTLPIVSNKKIHRAWSMYDWANSAYSLVITTTIFPAYYTAITSSTSQDGTVINDQVRFFGLQLSNSSLFDYTVAAAYLIIALLSPILSSVADLKGNKKAFMRLFCYIGSAACAGLYFFRLETLEWGIILFAIAAVGFCGSQVFYNAYLPEIAYEQEQDKVSAQGFAYGYIGSVLLQLICFVFVLKPDWFGITDTSLPARLSFLLVGVWWFAFAHIPLIKLPKGTPRLHSGPKQRVLSNGFKELRKVFDQLRHLPVLKTYLAAFFCYSMGVQTVMLAATLFGSKVLHLQQGELIATILIIQLVAIAGAFLMSKLSERIGNLSVLAMVVLIWIAVCIGAYFTTGSTGFYCLAAVVGLIMGGIQSLSRSTYSKLMPDTPDTTSFFSFYDVTEKVAIVIGMFSFGLIDHLTGNMRNAILTLIIYFLVGWILLRIAIRRDVKHQKASSAS